MEENGVSIKQVDWLTCRSDRPWCSDMLQVLDNVLYSSGSCVNLKHGYLRLVFL